MVKERSYWGEAVEENWREAIEQLIPVTFKSFIIHEI